MTESKSQSINIYLLSDIHVGNSNLYTHKKAIVQKLISHLEKEGQEENNIVVLAGDLTDHGFGKSQFLCFFCFLCMNSCCTNFGQCSEDLNETTDFIEEIFKPLKKVNPDIMICHGNHDESSDNMSYPILDFIKNTYSNVTKQGFYNIEKMGILFVILGKYPNKEALSYFENLHLNNLGKLPYVIIFHYQVYTSPSLDFWSQQEKEEFTKVCSDDSKNILCILHGHIHTTEKYILQAGNKEIPVICGSAVDSYAKITISTDMIGFNEIF